MEGVELAEKNPRDKENERDDHREKGNEDTYIRDMTKVEQGEIEKADTEESKNEKEKEVIQENPKEMIEKEAKRPPPERRSQKERRAPEWLDSYQMNQMVTRPYHSKLQASDILMSSWILNRLDLDIAHKLLDAAFAKVKDEFRFEECSLVLVTEKYYKQALDFIRESFVPDEPIEKALELEWSNELESIWMGMLRNNMSLLLINDSSGDVVGIKGISTVKLGDKYNTANYKNDSIKKFCQFMDDVGDISDVFGYFGEKEAIHFLALGVTEAHRQRGLGSRLLQCGLAFMRYLELGSVFITGECSSNYSKKIYEKHGFEILYEQFYEDYKLDGQVVICNTGDHKSMKVYGKRV